MTWLYLPSTSSPCAPEATASISASSWQCRVLEASVWWRGKPSRSLDWSRRCGKVSFLKLLYGVMPDPSTAGHGAGSWMASLAASRANLTASPAAAAVLTIPATSGPRRGASSSNPARGGVSSRTSLACSRRKAKSLARSVSGETYKDWVLRLRADFLARRKLARATSVNGFSSSAWPTARASEAMSKPGSTRRGMDPSNARLEDTVAAMTAKMWPTALVADAGEKVTLASKQHGLMHAAARLWPTPISRDHRSMVASEETLAKNARPLSEFVGMWSTPRASDGEKGGPNMSFGAGGEPLPSMAANWMTPRVSTGKWMNQKNGSRKLTIDGQATAWATPSVADTTGGRMARSGPRSSEMLLKGQAEQLSVTCLSTPPSPEMLTHGGQSLNTQVTFYLRCRATTDSCLKSEMRALLRLGIRKRKGWASTAPMAFIRPSFRRSLNPRFVEWLMGWPSGWTNCGCSEMALSHWRQQMRTVLLSLASPREAPAAQLSLAI